MGFIEEVEHAGADLPSAPDIGVKVLVDVTQPLIPGCYLPLYDN